MIISATAATTTPTATEPTPTGVLVLLAVLGIAAICYGGRWALDISGAIDTTLTRRRAALELKAQQTGNLGLTQTDGVSRSYFRYFGIVITLAGLILLALSAILATH
ncbi:hypothetical protein AB0D35_32640 [Streptomyces sp. NPDC048301]|uniref:hypothetical protein n=1 Tax=unclassified Streptomyces TaxID=2593676 RepID=UPI0034127A36